MGIDLQLAAKGASHAAQSPWPAAVLAAGISAVIVAAAVAAFLHRADAWTINRWRPAIGSRGLVIALVGSGVMATPWKALGLSLLVSGAVLGFVGVAVPVRQNVMRDGEITIAFIRRLLEYEIHVMNHAHDATFRVTAEAIGEYLRGFRDGFNMADPSGEPQLQWPVRWQSEVGREAFIPEGIYGVLEIAGPDPNLERVASATPWTPVLVFHAVGGADVPIDWGEDQAGIDLILHVYRLETRSRARFSCHVRQGYGGLIYMATERADHPRPFKRRPRSTWIDPDSPAIRGWL